jgi:hypothetical protein
MNPAMGDVTNFDVLVVYVIGGAVHLLGLAAIAYMAWRVHLEVKQSRREAQRFWTSTAGMIVQESSKILERLRSSP